MMRPIEHYLSMSIRIFDEVKIKLYFNSRTHTLNKDEYQQFQNYVVTCQVILELCDCTSMLLQSCRTKAISKKSQHSLKLKANV